jgi:tetratricopeptide (TPR) repeat protein
MNYRRRVDIARAREFAATARRLAHERTSAPDVVDPILQNTAREHWTELAELPQLQTAGALERLGNLFAKWLPTDVHHAKAIADLAVAVSEAVPEISYPAVVIAQLRAHAWKDHGIAERTLARFDESLEAFATAAERISSFAALHHDRAIIDLAAALTLQELDRFDEALSLATHAKQVFIDHGDVKRQVLTTFAHGVLLQRMKHHREAREVYAQLLDTTPAMEPAVLAALHRAIGFASIDLEDFSGAEVHLGEAIRISRELSQHIEVTRSQLAFGRLLIRRGDHQQATTYLRPVRRQFLEAGLIEEAGLCGLDVVEGMLNLGNSVAAQNLAREIIAEFMRAGLNKRAITAVGYLQEAIASSGLSNSLVTEIREYIVSLRTHPERDFRPAQLMASSPES